MSNLSENNSPNKVLISTENSKEKMSEEDLIIKYIKELKDEEKRPKALSKLSEYYEKNTKLPIYLWYSQGTMAILLQEVISTYRYLSSGKYNREKALKIRKILCLFLSLASNQEISAKFVESKMPIYLYPFLNSTSTAKQNEYNKILVLTIVSNLMKSRDPKIIHFFIKSELIPILLKILDGGLLISKTQAILMIHYILNTDEGLDFICEDKMRCLGIITYTRSMLKYKINVPLTLKTFLRLAQNSEARIIMREKLMKEIMDKNFLKHLDNSSKLLCSSLVKILNEKEEDNKPKINQKELNIKNTISNNNIPNNNLVNDNMKNGNNNNNSNNNQQIKGDMINQYNMNNNMMFINQLNQMKISQPYMMNTNFNDINNYKLYNNGNENFMNNFAGNQNNNNKQFANINFYNLYKSS